MKIENVEQKLEFYKSLLKENEECYILCETNEKITPLFIKRSEAAESGFFELDCVLFDYSFTKGNAAEEKFMKEQGYEIIGNRAYDIQNTFQFFPFDKYFGEFKEVTKKECIEFLKK